jgi:glucose/mannose transport system permease protein
MKRHPMWPMIIPFALLVYFVYVGIGWNLWVSFGSWKGMEPSYALSGLGQYVKMFQSENFLISLGNTLLLFLIIPICVLLGLGLAIILDKGLKGTSIFRNLFLLPFALSYVVTGTVWAWMYEPSNGIINSLFRMLGLNSLMSGWCTQQETVMASIILALVWQFSGYVAIIFLGGIKSVPQNQINAAKLDGAYNVRIYLKLILPQLKGALTSAITIIAMFALRSFDFIWQLTGGGPGYSSHTLPILMYEETFMKSKFSYGAAIGSFLLALVLILVLPFTYRSKKGK